MACLIVVIRYANTLPAVFHDIFVGAFTPSGVTGGVVGSMVLVITWGVKRGVFSNEAGLGSAPIAHAATSETDCVKQGLYGIFEVFMDTILICTLSGLTILCAAKGAGLDLNIGTEGNTSLNAAALGTVFSQKGGAIIIAVGLALFAFSTVLGWSLYGTRCCEFLFGHKAIKRLSDHLHHRHLCGCDHEAGPGLGHRRYPQRPHGYPEPDRPGGSVRRGGQGNQAALLRAAQQEVRLLTSLLSQQATALLVGPNTKRAGCIS